ncbi:hypothetical protein DVK02_12340 [Halobellus sp. Atlit-31R]|nr:hypothetical protein DVK02_12340 [Halobellus sp. Atlit-31R]
MGASSATAARSRKRLLVGVVVAVALTGAGVGALADGSAFTLGAASVESDGGSASEATIDVVAGDPANVRNSAGDAGVVAGSLGGTLTVVETTDRVEFVVQTRLPDGSWAVTATATATSVPPGPFDLATQVGGANTTYLDAAQSDGFDVQTPGTVAVRRGAVAVTARLFVDGQEVAAVTDVDGYAFAVDRPAGSVVSLGTADTEPAATGGGDTGGSDSPADAPDSLNRARTSTGATDQIVGAAGGTGGPSDGGTLSGSTSSASDSENSSQTATVLFGADDVVPGSTGTSSAVLEPPREEMRVLNVTVGAAIDAENGLTEPESEVDDTPADGELSERLDVRVFLVRESGVREYVAGSEDGFVSLAAAAGTTTEIEFGPAEPLSLVVEWRIDPRVGNEIQSDSTTGSVHYRFTS